MSAAPLRVGLIGAGNISRAHLPAYRDHPERVALVAVCDMMGESARRVATDFGLAQHHTEVGDMLASVELDAVDICLPHDQHHPAARAALLAGKHVLVEKPFAVSMAQCGELVRLAEERGLTLMVGQMQRYHGTYRSLKALIDGGGLGTIRHARIDALQNLHDYAEPPHWLYDGRRAGGGGVISVAVHRIDLLRYLIGDAAKAVAWGRTVDPAFRDAEDYAVALIEFENGALVDLFSTYSAAALPYGEMFWVFGDRGVAHTLPPEGKYVTERPRIAYRDGTKSGRVFTEMAADPGAGLPTGNAFVNEILHFAECVRERREPLSGGRDNLRTMAIIHAVYRSMRSGGAPVDVREVIREAG